MPENDPEADVVRPGVTLAGRYVVGEAIGRGGMAMVYRGHDELLDRDVAVKVLGSVAASAIGTRQEFLREARAAAALSHSNIVGVFDAGVHGTDRYIIMEYVPGGSLSEIIQSDAPLPPRRVVQFAGQLADALDYGHRHGIVHCDVKPQNVLIDESGRPKLVDFGISRSIAATGALTDTISGTAGYIAPEQLLGEPVDGRVDIYALGCVVYEMLSGQLPFDASNLAALATQRLVRPPIPLERRNAAVPAVLADAVMRAIEREPSARYASAHEFGRAMTASLAGQGNAVPPHPARQTASIPNRPVGTTVIARPARPSARPSGGQRLFWPLTLIALGVLILAGALAAVRLPSLLGQGAPTVSLPSVTGERIDQATPQLRDLGLAIAVNLRDTSANGVCTGQVLAQDPSPATQIARGRSVSLVVSRNDQC
jgi:serine/threonine protein kinase